MENIKIRIFADNDMIKFIHIMHTGFSKKIELQLNYCKKMKVEVINKSSHKYVLYEFSKVVFEE